MAEISQQKVTLHFTHVRRIKKLFQERYNLQEIFIMYKEKIPYDQLRGIVRGIKRQERI